MIITNDFTVSNEIRQKIQGLNFIDSVINLVLTTKFNIILNEGIIALTLLAADTSFCKLFMTHHG
jgi:hypothetical protein